MNEHPRTPGEPLPDGVPVYRGLRASRWLFAGTRGVHPVAFLRRQDEEQVSVSESATNSVRHLRRHYGAAELMTDCVRPVTNDSGEPLGLDVVADPILSNEYYDPLHAGITGLPSWAPPGSGDEQAALEAAVALVASCRPTVRDVVLEREV